MYYAYYLYLMTLNQKDSKIIPRKMQSLMCSTLSIVQNKEDERLLFCLLTLPEFS